MSFREHSNARKLDLEIPEKDKDLDIASCLAYDQGPKEPSLLLCVTKSK